MRLWTAFVVLACSLARPAYAYDPKPLDGGFWFSRQDTLRLLDDVERRLPEALRLVDLQAQVIDMQEAQVQTATTALDLTGSVAAANLEYANVWRAAYEDARCTSFLCDPAVQVIGGFLAGAGIATAIFFGASSQ